MAELAPPASAAELDVAVHIVRKVKSKLGYTEIDTPFSASDIQAENNKVIDDVI